MKHSRHLALGLALFSWFAFCQGCASDTPSDTYRTSYRISLADIPELVPLDSMRLEVRIDGVLDTSISVPQAALLDRNFSYTVESVSGALIDIDYVVYSGTTAVAEGHDHYDPRVAAPDTVALARDTAAIRVILDGISYSKALSIAFAGRSDTLTETTSGNLSAGLRLLVMGPAGAQTDSAMNVVVSALPTSAMSATDYSLVATVRIPAGVKVGTLVAVELALRSDNLVEGPEILDLALTGHAGLPVVDSLKTFRLTARDADSAWVEFRLAQDSVFESGSALAVVAELHTNNVDAALQDGIEASLKALPSSTAKAQTHYQDFSSSPLLLTFPAGSKAGATASLQVKPLDVAYWNERSVLDLALAVTHAAVGGKDTTQVIFRNDDYEYYQFLSINPNNSSQALLGVFDGGLNPVQNFPFAIQPGQAPLFLLATPAGHTQVFTASQRLHRWEGSAWDAGTLYRTPVAGKTMRHVSVVPGDSVLWEFMHVVSSFTFTNICANKRDPGSAYTNSDRVLMAPEGYAHDVGNSNQPFDRLAVFNDSVANTWSLRYIHGNGINPLPYLKADSIAASGSGLVGGLALVEGSNALAVSDDTVLVLVGKTLKRYRYVGFDFVPIADLSLASLTGFSAARGMLLTQRHTLVLWDDQKLYEITAKTGALVRQRAHGLVSIQDMVYQPQGSATPEP